MKPVKDLPAQLSTITPVLTPTKWEGEQTVFTAGGPVADPTR